jgi:hypothetical protein
MSGYAFLELLKEQEAMARGANLGDKIHHAVYKTIKSNSTVDAVRHNALYHVGVNIPDVLHLTKKDLLAVLSRLIADRVITQIFIFYFEPGQTKIAFRPVFITLPSEERQTIGQLFQEGIVQSARAVESFLDSLPPATPELIWQDLEKDLVTEHNPSPAELPSSIIDPFAEVHGAAFEVAPAPDMIATTLSELQESLAKRGRLLHVLDYGFMPIREREILERVEAAADFLLARVVPKYRMRGNLKAELEQVRMEEATYYLNENVAKTAEFAARRATLIKKTILSDPGRKGVRYPGALACETLLLVEPFSRPRYQELWKAELNSVHMQFKERLKKETNNWEELLLFIDEKDTLGFPKEAWKRITEDRELLHNTWERPDTTVHVFLRKDADAFRVLVEGMDAVPLQDHWKILAMKFLLDRFESHFSSLFHDENFVRSYGRLLRIAYIDYIPWYFRIFIWLGLNWFQDRSFQIAKQRIQSEQHTQAGENQSKAVQVKEEREKEKHAMLARIQEMGAANQVIEALDRFYFNQQWIPSVVEVQGTLKEMELSTFRDTLARDRFQIVKEGRGNPAEDILVYPANHEWRVRSGRLRRAIDRMAQAYPEAMQSDEAKTMHDRMKRLIKFLSRREREIPALDREDPYEKFEKALKSQKQKEAQENPPAREELEV